MSDETKSGPQTPNSRYEDLSQFVRLLVGSMKKLEKASKQNTRVYWTQSVNHWILMAKQVIENKNHFEPPLTLQLAAELEKNIEALTALADVETPIGEIRVIVDGLKYRLTAMYDSVVTLEGVRTSIAEMNLLNLKENIAGRINALSTEIDDKDKTHDETEDIRSRLNELKKLI